MRMKKDQLVKLVKDAEELLKKNDSLQASEKLYKVAEECVKKLAIKHDMALKDKRKWNTIELTDFARRLKGIYGENLYNNWTIALEKLHKDGFHENGLTTLEVFESIHNVTELLDLI